MKPASRELTRWSSQEITKFAEEVCAVIKIDQGINGTSLIKFKTNVGEKSAKAFLAGIIIKNSKFFNLVDNLTEGQSIEIADLLITEYPYITVEDINIMFRYAKTGKPGYEKPMSRLDGSVVFRWINTYIEEKLDRIEFLASQENQAYKEEPISPEFLERVASLIKEKTEPKEPLKPINRISFNKHEQYLRENISHFTVPQIKETIKHFTNQNMFHDCDKLIEFLNEELTKKQKL